MQAGPADEVSRRALGAERLRGSRLIARIRFVGISIAFFFNWIMPGIFADAAQYQAPVPAFAAYWVAAGVLYLAGRRCSGDGFSSPPPPA